MRSVVRATKVVSVIRYKACNEGKKVMLGGQMM